MNHPICDSCFAICRFALSILHRRVKIIPPRGRFVKSFLAVLREKFLFCVFFCGSASFEAAPFRRYFPAFCASLFQWARRAGRKCALQRQPWARRRRRQRPRLRGISGGARLKGARSPRGGPASAEAGGVYIIDRFLHFL